VGSIRVSEASTGTDVDPGRHRWVFLLAVLLCAPGCLSGLSFDELPAFSYIGTREWMTATYFVDGVEHDSHTFVVAEHTGYCERAKALRESREVVADAYWSWVATNVGWDVERGTATLGAGTVEIPDVAARRVDWLDRTQTYLGNVGGLWQDNFGGTSDIAFLQFHRGTLYAGADQTEFDSPLGPARDGEGEIAIGVHPQDGDRGVWQWSAAFGYDVGNPYDAISDGLDDSDPAAFAGLSAVWTPEASGDWYRATGGTAETSRSSVHSWDLDLLDGEVVDQSADPAGGFRMWGNYYRCFVEYGELEPSAV
jgi:hypothetical protein